MKKIFSTTNIFRFISTIPLLFLFAFSSIYIYKAFNNYKNIENLRAKFETAQNLLLVSKELNAERNIDASYIQRDNEINKKAIFEQRTKTDLAIKRFLRQYSLQATDKEVEEIKKQLVNISSIRNKIDNFDYEIDDLFFEYYFKINKTIEKEMENLKDYSISPKGAIFLDIYAGLYKEANLLSLERDYVARFLMISRPMGNNELKIWLEMFNKERPLGFYIPDDRLSAKINSILSSTDTINLYMTANNFASAIIRESYIGNYSVDAQKWHEIMNKKLLLNSDIINLVDEKIISSINEFKNEYLLNLLISSVVWLLSVLFLILAYKMRIKIKISLKKLNNILNIIKSENKDIKLDLDSNEGLQKAYEVIENALDQIQYKESKNPDSSRSKSIFLSHMSHDLRTPLNGIIGFIELLKNSKLSAKDNEIIDIIQRSSNDLLKTINNLLSISRIENDEITMQPNDFIPIKEFENIVEIYAQKAREKNVDFNAFIDPALSYKINGDIEKLNDSLANLISGTINFAHKNRKIIVKITKFEQADDYTIINFSIKDNGTNIEALKQGSIFDDFISLKNSAKNAYSNTQLGLSIADNYISMMGAEVEAKSLLNGGGEFNFSIKFKNIEKKPAHKSEFDNIKIAVLTNDRADIYNSFIHKYLEYLGVNVTFFTNSSQVGDFDIVLLRLKDYAIPLDLKDKKLIVSVPNKRLAQGSMSLKKSATICEPVTLSKMINALNLLIKDEEEEEKSFKDIKFNADILIAEDEDQSQKAILEILSNICNVKMVENGEQAVLEAKNNSYDLIFMDLNMPIMNGISAATKIREYEKDKGNHTPIIAMANYDVKVNRTNLADDIFDAFLAKPINKSDIIKTLNNFIPDKTITHILVSPIKPYKKIRTNYNMEVFNLRDVLLFKKSSIENKIFSSAISGFCQNIDTVNSFEEFKERLEYSPYKIILIDYKIPNFNENEVYQMINRAKQKHHIGTITILFVDPNSTLKDDLRNKFDEIVKSNISKTQLETIVNLCIRTEDQDICIIKQNDEK